MTPVTATDDEQVQQLNQATGELIERTLRSLLAAPDRRLRRNDVTEIGRAAYEPIGAAQGDRFAKRVSNLVADLVKAGLVRRDGAETDPELVLMNRVEVERLLGRLRPLDRHEWPLAFRRYAASRKRRRAGHY